MGTLPDLRAHLTDALIAAAFVLLGGLGGYYLGRGVGEADLRYLIDMPPSDGVTQGMGIYMMPRFGIIASKLDQNRVHFLKVPSPYQALALRGLPRLSAPPTETTTTSTMPLSQEEGPPDANP